MSTVTKHNVSYGGCATPRQGKLERVVVDGQEFVRVELDGRSVLVPPDCPHRGTPMSEATVVGDFLICSRHGATFDLRTGCWVRGPQCGDIAVKIVSDGSSV